MKKMRKAKNMYLTQHFYLESEGPNEEDEKSKEYVFNTKLLPGKGKSVTLTLHQSMSGDGTE